MPSKSTGDIDILTIEVTPMPEELEQSARLYVVGRLINEGRSKEEMLESLRQLGLAEDGLKPSRRRAPSRKNRARKHLRKGQP